MPGRIPTHEELSRAAGFPVPPSLSRAWKASSELNPNDPSNGFDILGGGLRLFIPDEKHEIDEIPAGCVAFASLGDGAMLAFVLDDSADTQAERPVACFTYTGTGPDLYGMSLPGALCMTFRHEGDKPASEAENRELRAWLDHLAPDENEPTREPQITLARWRQGAIWTPDNIGVVVPESTVDRAFLQRIIWPLIGAGCRLVSAKPAVLEEAERRLLKGEVGTALVLARSYRYFWGIGSTETLQRTADILAQAYGTLGRALPAGKIRRQTARLIAKGLGSKPSRKP